MSLSNFNQNWFILFSLATGLGLFTLVESNFKKTKEAKPLIKVVNQDVVKPKPLTATVEPKINKVRFKDFIVSETTYKEALSILQRDKKFSKIVQKQGYSTVEDNQKIDLDPKNLTKFIDCDLKIFDSKANLSLYFYEGVLSKIVLNVDNDSHYKISRVLDDVYGYPTERGVYRYPNLKKDFIKLCSIWLPKEEDLEYSEYLDEFKNYLGQCNNSYISLTYRRSFFVNEPLDSGKNNYFITFNNRRYDDFIRNASSKVFEKTRELELENSKKEVL